MPAQTSKGITALDNVNLTIPDGQTFVVIGPSGCGKSTLLRVVAGIMSDYSGQILYDGADVQNILPGDRYIGMVFQNYAKLTGVDAIGSIFQGFSVSLSGDGNTALIGGYADNSFAGAAWTFARDGEVWSQQGMKLLGTGAVGHALQGIAVSVSADGSTAIVGGYGDSSYAGAAWIFTRSGGLWHQQGKKLVGSGAVGGARQGYSVSISGDGNTALVGGYYDNSYTGAAWIFTRSGDVWSQQGDKLLGTGAFGSAFQGSSVALSAEGNTALVGGYGDSSYAGAAWVFTRSGDAWTQQGTKLVGKGAVGRRGKGFPLRFRRTAMLRLWGDTVIVLMRGLRGSLRAVGTRGLSRGPSLSAKVPSAVPGKDTRFHYPQMETRPSLGDAVTAALSVRHGRSREVALSGVSKGANSLGRMGWAMRCRVLPFRFRQTEALLSLADTVTTVAQEQHGSSFGLLRASVNCQERCLCSSHSIRTTPIHSIRRLQSDFGCHLRLIDQFQVGQGLHGLDTPG